MDRIYGEGVDFKRL